MPDYTNNKANLAVRGYLLATTEDVRAMYLDHMMGIGWIATSKWRDLPDEYRKIILDDPKTSYQETTFQAKRRFIRICCLFYMSQFEKLSPDEIQTHFHEGKFRWLGKFIRNQFANALRDDYKGRPKKPHMSLDFVINDNNDSPKPVSELIVWEEGRTGRAALGVFTAQTQEPQYDSIQLLDILNKDTTGLQDRLGTACWETLTSLINFHPWPPEETKHKRGRKGFRTAIVSSSRDVTPRAARDSAKSLIEKMKDELKNGNPTAQKLFSRLYKSTEGAFPRLEVKNKEKYPKKNHLWKKDDEQLPFHPISPNRVYRRG